MRRTNIICTIGPSSSGMSVLREMALAGLDVARLNFSHGTHAKHQYVVDVIRQLHKKNDCNIKTLQDLEGYRIRIGAFKDGEGIELKKGQKLLLTNQEITGEKNIVPFDYEGPLHAIPMGSHIFIDDGNIALVITARTEISLEAEVIVPGVLRERSGVNMPGVELPFKGLTQKDKIDLQFGIRNRVDYLAQSFVRDKEDIIQLRELLSHHHAGCEIIAKIENRQGIENIQEIIDVSDGIMIARGDMGVSIPIYEIPIVQKEIIRKCNQAQKFVITATQMLESMVEHVRPTRAEVTDVANAVLDGTDFVMLSAETATGRHPVEAVRMMSQIVTFAENYKRIWSRCTEFSGRSG